MRWLCGRRRSAALGIELDHVRRPELARPVPVLPMILRNLPLRSNTEMRPTRFGFRHSYDSRHVNVAVARIGGDVGRLGQGIGGFPLTPGFPSVISTLPSGLNLTATLPSALRQETS